MMRRDGSTTIRTGMLLAALAMCVGVCACGDSGSSSAATSGLTPTADRAEAQTRTSVVWSNGHSGTAPIRAS